MFRDSFKKGRCLIPATGFYEWQKAGSGPSRPFFVALASGAPFAFAGLWRRNRLADGSCSTAAPSSPPTRRLCCGHPPPHAGDPAPGHQPLWLDPALKDPEFLQALLTPVPEAELAVWEVGRAVSNPRTTARSRGAPGDVRVPKQPSLFELQKAQPAR